jgi:4-hydroxy-3-methylbut-2-enyl diphosphate reductase
MEIIVGKYSGFCAGVNYTYSKALEELKNGPLYCLGKIIHNEHVIKELEDKGMITVNSLSEIPDNSSVIFRAHGEPLSSYLYAKEHNINVIDLTCGKVKIIHNKVEKMKDDNYIIIIGKKTHPEIIGTMGFAGEYYSVIEDESDIAKLKEEIKKSNRNNIFVISQTTFSNKQFDELIEEIKKELKDYKITIDKSICNATEKRQLECEDISKNVDIMIVIGSQNSSNTRELYNIAIKNCKNVIFAENVESIKNKSFDYDKVGVVAGASAPKNLIETIVSNIK